MARRGTSPVLFPTFGLVAALAWQSGVGSLPVAAQSASPVAAIEETLLEITIPPDLLPQGDRILSELIYITAPGGSTASWQEIHYADWPGLRVHHLLIGSLSVRAEGAAHVVRAGGASVEDVPAGVEAVLGPGDTWLARNEVSFEAVNTSTSPMHLLLWVAANNEHPTELVRDAFPGAWFFGDMNPLPQGVEVPAGPVTLSIRRIELPVEGRVAAMPGAIQHAVRPPMNLEGTPIVDPSVGVLPSGAVVNIGRKPVPVYILSLESSEAGAGTPVAGTGEA